MPKNKIISLVLILSATLFLSGCTAKKNTTKITPTPTPRLIQLDPKDRPYISLIPRADGHLLTLKIDRIPKDFSQIEYELIYTAVDQGNEIEKGLGDTLNVDAASISRELLLGTESCTHGCKYKYDEGVTGGTLTLTLISTDDQVTTYESQFTLTNSTDIKRTGKISLASENFEINALPQEKSEYFVVLKNYGVPSGNQSSEAYSVFSSLSGKGTVKSISPADFSKENKNLISGDYLKP